MLLILQPNKTTSTHILQPTFSTCKWKQVKQPTQQSIQFTRDLKLWDLTCTTIAIRISGNAIPSTQNTIVRPAQVEQQPLRKKELHSIYTFSPLSWLHLIFFKRWKLGPLFSVKTDSQHSSGEQSGVSSQSSSFKTQVIGFQAWRANRASPSLHTLRSQQSPCRLPLCHLFFSSCGGKLDNNSQTCARRYYYSISTLFVHLLQSQAASVPYHEDWNIDNKSESTSISPEWLAYKKGITRCWPLASVPETAGE